MAFVKVEKLRVGGHGPTEALVTLGASLADDKNKSKHLTIRISRPLIGQLGWEIKERKLHLAVHEGTDTDVGFLQLIPDDVGRRSTVEDNTNQGVSINISVASFKHYVLNECPVSMMRVPHMIDDKALVIECPDWLRFNPQSVPEPKPAPVTQLHRTRRQRG